MAELLLKVKSVDDKNPAMLQDGDVIIAISDLRTAWVHAEVICKEYKLMESVYLPILRHGKRWVINDTTISQVWDEIEARTKLRRVNFTKFPWGRNELKHHFVLPSVALTVAECQTYSAPLKDANRNIVQARRYRVNYKSMTLPVSQTDLDNPELSIDVRDAATPVDKVNIVEKAKPKGWPLSLSV